MILSGASVIRYSGEPFPRSLSRHRWSCDDGNQACLPVVRRGDGCAHSSFMAGSQSLPSWYETAVYRVREVAGMPFSEDGDAGARRNTMNRSLTNDEIELLVSFARGIHPVRRRDDRT